MAVSGNYFFDQVRQYAPMTQGVPYQPTYGYQGLPGGNTGGLAGAAFQQFGMQPLSNMMQRQTGMMPMGMHSQNVFDSMQQMRFTRMHDEVLRQSAETDRRTYMDTYRGVAAISGTPWGAEQRQAASKLSDMGVALTPMLAQTMPNLLDAVSGVRGSATVLASQIHLGSRYQLDPVSGRMGYSVNTASKLANQLYEDLYEDPAAFSQMRGITAGQAGGMYRELAKRGMVRTATGTLDERTIKALQSGGADTNLINQIAVEQGMPMTKDAAMVDFKRMNSEQLSELRDDPRIQQQLRGFNASKVKTTINTYKDAIAAVRDIFGGMGKSNAPMSELIAGLEAMTGGNLSQIDPGRLNMMVRNTYNLAQQTGIGMNGAMAMQNHAAMTAAQMGLDPTMAIQATQGAMAYGGAYRAMGRGSYTAWGRMGAEELQQLDVNLRLGASNSAAANQAGVALRLAESTGGFDKGSLAASYTSALRGGSAKFTHGGKEHNVGDFDDVRFQQMLVKGGGGNVNEAMLNEMLADNYSNQEYIERFDVGNTVRRTQHIEMQRWAGRRMGETFQSQLAEHGVNAKDAAQLGARAGDAVMNALTSAGPEIQTDSAKRRLLVQQTLRNVVGEQGGLTDEQLSAIGETSYGYLNTSIRGGKYKAFRSAQGLFQALDPEVQEEGMRQRATAQATSMMQHSLTGIGRGGLLRRAFDAVRAAKPGDDIMKTIARATMIDPKDISKGMRTGMGNLNQMVGDYERKQGELANAKTPEQRQRIMAELGQMQKGIQGAANHLQQGAIEEGFLVSDTIGADDFTAAGDNLDLLSRYRGTIGDKATDTQWGQFWDSTEGDEFRRASRLFGADSADIADRLLGEKQAVNRLGKNGLNRVEAFGSRQGRMRELAARHAGGDMARLVAGDFSGDMTDKKRKELRQEVGRMMDQQKQDYTFFEGVLSGKHKGEAMSDEEQAELRTRASDVQKKLGLGGIDSTLSSMYTTFGMAERWDEVRHTGSADQMRQILSSGSNKQMLAEVISARKTSKEIAKEQGFDGDTAGWKTFVDKYEKAKTDGDRMGLSQEKWDRLDYSMQTQKRTGFLRFGSKGLYTEEDLPDMLGKLSGERSGRGGKDQDPQGFPKTIRIEGKLSVDGELKGEGEFDDVPEQR